MYQTHQLYIYISDPSTLCISDLIYIHQTHQLYISDHQLYISAQYFIPSTYISSINYTISVPFAIYIRPMYRRKTMYHMTWYDITATKTKIKQLFNFIVTWQNLRGCLFFGWPQSSQGPVLLPGIQSVTILGQSDSSILSVCVCVCVVQLKLNLQEQSTCICRYIYWVRLTQKEKKMFKTQTDFEGFDIKARCRALY